MDYDCETDGDYGDPETWDQYIDEFRDTGTGNLESNTFSPRVSTVSRNESLHHNSLSSTLAKSITGGGCPIQTCRKGTASTRPDIFTDRTTSGRSQTKPRTKGLHDQQLLSARSHPVTLSAALHDESTTTDSESEDEETSKDCVEDIETQKRTGWLQKNRDGILTFSTPMSSISRENRRCQICHRRETLIGGIYTNYILCRMCRAFLAKNVEKPRKSGYKCITNGNCRVEDLPRGEWPCARCRIKKAIETGFILRRNHPYYTDVDNGTINSGLAQEKSLVDKPCRQSVKDTVDPSTSQTTAANHAQLDSTDPDTAIDCGQPSSIASKSSGATGLNESIVQRSHHEPSVKTPDSKEDPESSEFLKNMHDEDLSMQYALLESFDKKKPNYTSSQDDYRPELMELSKELDDFGLPKNIQDLFNKWFYDDCSQMISEFLPRKDLKDEVKFKTAPREKIVICNQFAVSDPRFPFMTENIEEVDPSDEIKISKIEIQACENLQVQETTYVNSRIGSQLTESIKQQGASDDAPELSIIMKVNRTIIDRRPAELKKMNQSLRTSQNSTSDLSQAESVIAPGEDCDDSDDCDAIEDD